MRPNGFNKFKETQCCSKMLPWRGDEAGKVSQRPDQEGLPNFYFVGHRLPSQICVFRNVPLTEK